MSPTVVTHIIAEPLWKLNSHLQLQQWNGSIKKEAIQRLQDGKEPEGNYRYRTHKCVAEATGQLQAIYLVGLPDIQT